MVRAFHKFNVNKVAAYKAAELARLMVKKGWTIDVIMTGSATRFVSALTFKTLTRRPVVTDMFAEKLRVCEFSRMRTEK